MKIVIVGTGVIGTLYALPLSKNNHILHYVRKEKFNKYQYNTIHYDIIDERLPSESQNITGEYTYMCCTTIPKECDLIIVPVNTFQLTNVLHELKSQAPNTNYLLMTLNWNGTNAIDNILSKNQYIMGYAGGGGTFKENLLWADLGNDIMLGYVYEEQKELLTKVDKLFKEQKIIPNIQNNILHSLWIHNIDSAPLGVALSKYRDIIKLVNDKDLVKTCFNAINECFGICSKLGVNLSDFPEVNMYAMPFDEIYPMFKNNFETNPVMQRFSAHAVQAIDEMIYNFKQIYNTGKTLDYPMPNMDILNNIIPNK